MIKCLTREEFSALNIGDDIFFSRELYNGYTNNHGILNNMCDRKHKIVRLHPNFGTVVVNDDLDTEVFIHRVWLTNDYKAVLMEKFNTDESELMECVCSKLGELEHQVGELKNELEAWQSERY